MTRTVDDVLYDSRHGTRTISDDERLLRDEIQRLRALTTWRPIETAPKDGTAFVSYLDDGQAVFVKYVLGHFVCSSATTRNGQLGQPTHWLPLPEPPR